MVIAIVHFCEHSSTTNIFPFKFSGIIANVVQSTVFPGIRYVAMTSNLSMSAHCLCVCCSTIAAGSTTPLTSHWSAAPVITGDDRSLRMSRTLSSSISRCPSSAASLMPTGNCHGRRWYRLRRRRRACITASWYSILSLTSPTPGVSAKARQSPAGPGPIRSVLCHDSTYDLLVTDHDTTYDQLVTDHDSMYDLSVIDHDSITGHISSSMTCTLTCQVSIMTLSCRVLIATMTLDP